MHPLKPSIKGAAKKSRNNRKALETSQLCGCYYCEQTFSPREITVWVDEDKEGWGRTALCPRCHIDAVLGDTQGIGLSHDTLKRLHVVWFGE